MQDNTLNGDCTHLSVKWFWAFLFVLMLMAFCTPAVQNVEAGYILDEEFNANTLGWSEADDSNKTLEIKNGKYYFEHKSENKMWITQIDTEIDQFKDFTIEASIGLINNIDSHSYGIVWGYLNPNNFFGFGVSINGKFQVYMYNRRTLYLLKDWTRSPHIHKILDNILSISKKGNDVFFKINGELVHKMPSPALFGDHVGFVVNRRLKVAVDYLKVSQDIEGKALPVREISTATDKAGTCKDTSLFFSRGNKLLKDSPEKAREMYYQAMQLCPESENAVYNYCIALYKTKYYKKAINILEQRLSANKFSHPQMVEFLIYLRLLRKEDVLRGRALASDFAMRCPSSGFAKTIFSDSFGYTSDELRAKYENRFTPEIQELDIPSPYLPPGGSGTIKYPRSENCYNSKTTNPKTTNPVSLHDTYKLPKVLTLPRKD